MSWLGDKFQFYLNNLVLKVVFFSQSYVKYLFCSLDSFALWGATPKCGLHFFTHTHALVVHVADDGLPCGIVLQRFSVSKIKLSRSILSGLITRAENKRARTIRNSLTSQPQTIILPLYPNIYTLGDGNIVLRIFQLLLCCNWQSVNNVVVNTIMTDKSDYIVALYKHVDK